VWVPDELASGACLSDSDMERVTMVMRELVPVSFGGRFFGDKHPHPLTKSTVVVRDLARVPVLMSAIRVRAHAFMSQLKYGMVDGADVLALYV
jgi:hypothetical protein